MARPLLQHFLHNKKNVWVQFIKYGMAGALASAAFIAVFTSLNETILPADRGQPGATRGWNFFIANSIAFIVANIIGYLANRAWVFQSGRHSTVREFTLFVGISFVAFMIGTPLGSWVVSQYPVSEYIIFVILMVVSTMVNFLGRKYVVFMH